MVTERDIYFFDLQGYIIVRGALSTDEVKACNDTLDAIPRIDHGAWWGPMQCHTYGTGDGFNYQQIYEAGEAFEKLIDHPSWIDKIKKFLGGENTFDMNHGPLFIDEAFASFREPGDAIGIHSGGDSCCKRNQYRVHNGQFMVGQVNVLTALTDIGPGDGGTVIIPGSHKQNFKHPDFSKHNMKPGGASGDGLEGSLEVHLNAGDSLIFADAICHGSAKRTNEDMRRVVIYRYGPSWGFFRHGFRPSQALLDRLTPEQRQIVWPHAALKREPQMNPDFVEDDFAADRPAVDSTGMGG